MLRDGGGRAHRPIKMSSRQALDDNAKLTGIHKRIFAPDRRRVFHRCAGLRDLWIDDPDHAAGRVRVPWRTGAGGERTAVRAGDRGRSSRGSSPTGSGARRRISCNLLLFGIATIVAAFVPNAHCWLAVIRFIAGCGAGRGATAGLRPMPGSSTPKRLRGRILAFIHFIGGALSLAGGGVAGAVPERCIWLAGDLGSAIGRGRADYFSRCGSVCRKAHGG